MHAQESELGQEMAQLVAGEEAGARPAGQNTQMPTQTDRMPEDARQFPAQALACKDSIAPV